MVVQTDCDGQPLIQQLNYNRRINRALNELIGFLRGIVADEYINPAESDELAKWVLNNQEVTDIWPARVLVERLNRIYADGVADEEERADLKCLVEEIVGHRNSDTLEYGPTDLPLSHPSPDVVFDQNEFVLTGKFLFGTRRNCEREIELRGGRCGDNVRLQTSYVVVGSLMSRDWKYTTHGNKIAKAVEYSERCPIAIISERHWASFLG